MLFGNTWKPVGFWCWRCELWMKSLCVAESAVQAATSSYQRTLLHPLLWLQVSGGAGHCITVCMIVQHCRQFCMQSKVLRLTECTTTPPHHHHHLRHLSNDCCICIWSGTSWLFPDRPPSLLPLPHQTCRSGSVFGWGSCSSTQRRQSVNEHADREKIANNQRASFLQKWKENRSQQKRRLCS